MSLKSLADDLESFVNAIKIESAASTPAAPSDAPTLASVVRSTFDYVTTQLKEEDGADRIGEVFMVACAAIAKDAGLNEDEIQQSALVFLEGIVEAARSAL